MILIDDIKTGKKGSSFNAGSKARSDIDVILKNETLIFMDNANNQNLIRRSLDFFQAYSQVKSAPEDSVFLVQYPLYMINRYNDVLFDYLADKKSIALIHDINSLRAYPNQKEMHINEVKVLNRFHAIISHNKKMSAWLKENGLTRPIVELECFDYLYEGNVETKEKQYDISFAGNLSYEKSQFLYEAINQNQDVSFELFGVGFDEAKAHSNAFHYKGSKHPDELIHCFESGFGLIWDGDSITTCTGNFGNYERYNNPHKLSMSIAAQLPVIVWEEAAIADFVKNNHIGIPVRSLTNLRKTLDSVSPQEYATMKSNLRELSKKVQSGQFTKKAIEMAVHQL
ncbi:MAG: hypothetical protein J6D18_04460 [Erysipelotrichaceae bacterium]|nr:hypothetical protein [Erysipelotrichaceae bacterium]